MHQHLRRHRFNFRISPVAANVTNKCKKLKKLSCHPFPSSMKNGWIRKKSHVFQSTWFQNYYSGQTSTTKEIQLAKASHITTTKTDHTLRYSTATICNSGKFKPRFTERPSQKFSTRELNQQPRGQTNRKSSKPQLLTDFYCLHREKTRHTTSSRITKRTLSTTTASNRQLPTTIKRLQIECISALFTDHTAKPKISNLTPLSTSTIHPGWQTLLFTPYRQHN